MFTKDADLELVMVKGRNYRINSFNEFGVIFEYNIKQEIQNYSRRSPYGHSYMVRKWKLDEYDQLFDSIRELIKSFNIPQECWRNYPGPLKLLKEVYDEENSFRNT